MREATREKKMYSVHLTEGRIFVIFVILIVFTVIIFFGAAVIISNRSASNQLNSMEVVEENVRDLNQGDLSFYSGLNDDNAYSEEDLSLPVYGTDSGEIDNDIVAENNQSGNDTTHGDEIVNLDNSDTLYSSTTQDENNNGFVPSHTEKYANTVTTKNTTATKTQANSSENNLSDDGKKYVVQIGSYLDSQVVTDIMLHYKSQGYPVYVTEKINNGKKYYRLRVGPFSDKARADRYLEALQESKFGKNSYISIVYY